MGDVLQTPRLCLQGQGKAVCRIQVVLNYGDRVFSYTVGEAILEVVRIVVVYVFVSFYPVPRLPDPCVC
jgi:hypothetical protein